MLTALHITRGDHQMPDSIYNFDDIIDRHTTGSEKWDKYKDRDIIPLWVADMDFRSPPEVVSALHERIAHGIFGYTHPTDDLIEAVIAHVSRDFGWEIMAEWLVWIPGLVCGLNIACRAAGAEGSDVVTFTPVYPPFMSAPHLNRRSLIKVPLTLRDGRWSINKDELCRSVSAHTKLLLLCNPHNPVGMVWSREDLEMLAEIALQNDLIIGSDEIHAGLILDRERPHIPIAILSPEIARRTVTLLSPSKTYNIPGLGCSFAVIPDPMLRRSFNAAKAGIVPHVNALGYTAALAAYRNGEPWRRALLDYLRVNRDVVTEAVCSMPGLSMSTVEATYLAWIDTRNSGIENPVSFFESAGVGLSDGADFDGKGFVRLNFGCPRSLLKEALRRMSSALRCR